LFFVSERIQVLEEKLFGEYGTFESFVKGELTMSERQALRLIFAYRMQMVLKKAKCKTSASHESQIRPLARLPYGQTRLQVQCWNRACTMKKGGHAPTAADVTREVNRVINPVPTKQTEDDFADYRDAIETAKRELTKASHYLEPGNLDTFMMLQDEKS
jgi:hypothetical protein